VQIRLLPRSYRRRRRLAWGAGFVALASAIAIGISLLPKPPRLADEFGGQAYIDRPPKKAPMTSARRQAIDATINTFVHDAVLRQNPAAAFGLATPALRGGSTRKEWARGEAPVPPYPAHWFDLAEWEVAYSYRDLVGVDVRVIPRFRSGGYIQVYTAELVAVRRPERTYWLVDSWFPAKVVQPAEGGPPPQRPKSSENAANRPRAPTPPAVATPTLEEEKGRLGARWLLVPAGIFVLALAIPIAVFVRERVDARRLAKELRA
jgi:hypothetical protein